MLPRVRAEKYAATCPTCNSPLVIALGVPFTRSLETLDEYRGKKVPENLDKMLTDRAKEHFQKHDLPRIIEEQGIEFAKRQKWVDADGKPQ